MKLSAHAKIQVVVEVHAPGTYGADWTLDKIQEQAEREALAHLASVLSKGTASSNPSSIRVVGATQVIDVTMRKVA